MQPSRVVLPIAVQTLTRIVRIRKGGKKAGRAQGVPVPVRFDRGNRGQISILGRAHGFGVVRHRASHWRTPW